MVTRSVTFPEELYRKVKELAKQKGLTIATIIKIACDEYVKRESK